MKGRKLLLAILALIIVGCKKGKDDPLISLRSRDHRIVGTWILVKGSITYMANSGIQTNMYSETAETISGDLAYNPSGTGPSNVAILINKDGSTEFIYLNSRSHDIWHWNNGVKNKSGIYLPMSNFIIGRSCDFNFSVDRLTNKEMTLSYSNAIASAKDPAVHSVAIDLRFKKE